MPKYKEITINVSVKPETIFGEVLKGTNCIKAEQVIENKKEKA